MSKITGILLLVITICSLWLFPSKVYSYERHSSFVGKWEATVSERNDSVNVGLEFYLYRNNLEGKFEILTETGGDITKGMSFNLEAMLVRGNQISFVVPIFEKDDDDSLVFDLELNWKGLNGTMREMHSSSKLIPVTFNKVRRGFLY